MLNMQCWSTTEQPVYLADGERFGKTQCIHDSYIYCYLLYTKMGKLIWIKLSPIRICQMNLTNLVMAKQVEKNTLITVLTLFNWY